MEQFMKLVGQRAGTGADDSGDDGNGKSATEAEAKMAKMASKLHTSMEVCVFA